jgi:hypothetical protein
MSSSPSNKPSPSNPQTDRATSAVTEALSQQYTTTSTVHSSETPQSLAGQRSQSTPPAAILYTQPIASIPRPQLALAFDHDPYTSQATLQADFVSRQGRPFVARSTPRTSSSQPQRRAGNPYARPPALLRARSQSRPATMSSASTPSNTSTAGASSGSNPSYQLPYAPFPYPMPANGGQQSGKGGNGK